MSLINKAAVAVVALGASVGAANAQNTPTPGPGLPGTPPITGPGGGCNGAGCNPGTPNTPSNTINNYNSASASAKATSFGTGIGLGGGGSSECGEYIAGAVGAYGVAVGAQFGHPNKECILMATFVRAAIHSNDRALQSIGLLAAAGYSELAENALNRYATAKGCRGRFAEFATVCANVAHAGEEAAPRRQRRPSAPRRDVTVDVVRKAANQCPTEGTVLECKVVRKGPALTQ